MHIDKGAGKPLLGKEQNTMEHTVRINVARPNGPPAQVLRSRTVHLRQRLLDFLFGKKMSVLVLSPGDSVHTVEIREVKEGGKKHG